MGKVNRKGIVTSPHSSEKCELARRLRRDSTPAESLLWSRLRRSQLDDLHFRRQQVIDGFVADFYCHSAALIVELDGEVHEYRREYDAERDAILGARGLRILRIPNDELLYDLEAALERIRVAASRQ